MADDSTSADWTSPPDSTGDIWGAGLLGIVLVILSGLIGLVMAWLFSLGPAAGLVGLVAGPLACWACLVEAMALLDGDWVKACE